VAFRELTVIEIREILRRWQNGDGYRTVAAEVGADRKTVRRYVEAACRHGLSRDPDSRTLDDALLAHVIADVLPGAPRVVGENRQLCRRHAALIEDWLKAGCKAPKIGRLLARHTGVVVPPRTLQRFIEEDLSEAAKRSATVRVVDPPPGQILEVDFMRVGRFTLEGTERTVHALVCIAAFSRHTFVWPCLTMTRTDVIEGLEAAWDFFGGVFPAVVTDNPKPIVLGADPLSPRISPEIMEYSQDRGFVLDLARVRRPQDKPRVERVVPYVRSDGFAGERFVDLDQMRSHATRWCREVAGRRRHGTTRRQPLEAFLEDEQELLGEAPAEPYDTPRWVDLKVGRDHAVVVAQALYSVPYAYRGQTLRVRIDRQQVKMMHHGVVVKVHARLAPGGQRIDPMDLPPGVAELATRDAEGLQERAARHGPSVEAYAQRLLEGELPWTRMRHVYRLLGLCRRYGDDRVDTACRRALELDVIDVTRIDRMLSRALEDEPLPTPPRGQVIALKYARDPREFRATRAHDGGPDDP
jgi:transposase